MAFDPDTGEVTGDPVPVLDDATDPEPQGTQALGLAISSRGTLFYTTYQVHPFVRLALVEPGAAAEVLPFPARPTVGLAVSPDDRTIVASTLE